MNGSKPKNHLLMERDNWKDAMKRNIFRVLEFDLLTAALLCLAVYGVVLCATRQCAERWGAVQMLGLGGLRVFNDNQLFIGFCGA